MSKIWANKDQLSKIWANKDQLSKLWANMYQLNKHRANMDQMAKRRWGLRARRRMCLKELIKGQVQVRLKLLLEEAVAVQGHCEVDRRIGEGHPHRQLDEELRMHRLLEAHRAAPSRTTTRSSGISMSGLG